MSDFQEKLQQLRKNYAGSLEDRLSQIHIETKSLLTEWSQENAKTLHRLCHSLSGSGATYGYPLLSKAGRQLEELLHTILLKDIAANDNQLQLISEYLENIHEQIAAALQTDVITSTPDPDSIESFVLPTDPSNKENGNLVFLIEDDVPQSLQISSLITNAGYRVRIINHLESLEQKIQDEQPDAIVMDIVFPDEELGGTNFIRKLNKQTSNLAPTIFTSIRNDIETRLAALRADARYFLPKPLNNHKLIQCLNEITNTYQQEPYRVLIIDDDTYTANFHANILNASGITTSILSNPMKALDVIQSFRPELILMDLYMPECNGIELAEVIRQDESKHGVSIIFLSAEKETNKQISSLLKGGDDFIVKPVNAEHLASIVTARTERARVINNTNKELRIALRENQTQRLALDQHAIVSIADAEGTITYVNDRFCEVSKYKREELIDQNHRILNSGFHPNSFFSDMWNSISNGKIWQGEIQNKTKDGELYWVESTIMPFLDENGIPYQYISVRTDITPVRQSEIKLRKSEERLNRSQTFANIGTWDWNITTGDLFWSERIGPLFGYGEQEIDTTYDNFLAAVHPDDRSMVTESVAWCVESGVKYDIEHRIVTQDGDIRWVQERGDVTRDHDGNPLHMLGVVQDITRRKKAENEREQATANLNLAKEEAENANKAKSEFLSSMSHELRTPLNAILGFSQLLELDDEAPLSECQKENIDHITQSGWHLLELINEVLDLSKIEAGKVGLSLENTMLKDVLDDCLTLIGPLANEHDIRLINNIEPHIQSSLFYVDRTRLKQILLNLMSNAVKYNSKQGSVTFTASELNNGAVRIHVTDTGKGLNKESKSHLFKPFERVGAENTNIEGTGIGLVITKQLVELMGGNIGFESESGKGSTFWVEFNRITDQESNKDKESYTHTATGKTEDNNIQRGHTILYIEDNPANLNLVEQIMEQHREDTLLSAHNAEIGLDMARTHQPDLILLDINLPDIDGYEVLRQLKFMNGMKNVPVFAISANAMPADIKKGLDAGFLEYITKPININEFSEKLDSALKKIHP